MFPESQKTLQMLVNLQRSGQWQRAAAGYRQLLERDPSCVEGWHFYALLVYERGDPVTARQLMARAVELAPREPSIRTNLARMLREAGEFDAAEAQLKHALDAAPQHPPIWIQMAQLRLAQGRGDELRSQMTRLINAYPGIHLLWILLGQCHEQAADWDKALNAYAQVAKLAPEDPQPWLHLAEIKEHMGNIDAAEESYRQALERDSNCTPALCALGTLANQKGDFITGDRFSNRALAADPACYTAWLNKALSRQRKGASELLDDLRSAVSKAGADPEASPLYFALGMCLEAVKDYDAAFTAYAEANSRRAHLLGYDRDRQIRYFRDIVRHLDENFLARGERIGDHATRPIFVLGMPRSGTTLTESLLAAHSRLHAGGEMELILDILIRKAGRDVTTHRAGKWLATSGNDTLAEIAAEWRQGLDKRTPEGRRIIDKMPYNFMLVGLIHICFPHASIVHVRRNAMDNCFSCFATPFGQENSFSNDLRHLGEFYAFYETLMAHWRSVLGKQRFIEVSYEDLVNTPESELRRLFGTLELPWEEECLEHYRNRSMIRTASAWQARQPIYRTAQGRWRHFESHLSPLQEALADSAVTAELLRDSK